MIGGKKHMVNLDFFAGYTGMDQKRSTKGLSYVRVK